MSDQEVGPLAGVRVVVLAGMGPVPFASMLLADLGARVVRVTRPAHRAARDLAATSRLRDDVDVVNRGVESVPIDLKDPEGLNALLTLVRTANIFVEGFRPGVAERLGLGPDTLQKLNPALIYGRFTGYGQSGPLAHEAGHDINYVAQSGVLGAMAREGEAPRPPVNLLGDYAGGGAIGVLGLVAALYESTHSGRGQVIDIAMTEGVALLAAKLHGLRAAGSYSDVAGTNWIDSGCPAYDTYVCADGRYLAVGALEDDFYRAFLAGFDDDTSSWPAQGDRAEWPRLRALIGGAIAKRPRDEWIARYAGTDACVTPVLSFNEAAVDAHNRHRGCYVTVDGVLHPAPAPRFERTPCRVPDAGNRVRQITELLEEWNPTYV